MKRQKLIFCLACTLVPLAGWSAVVETPGIPAQAPPTTLTFGSKFSQPVRDVIKMSQSGVSEDVLRAYIENSGSTFNLTSENIVDLSAMRLPGTVVTTMLSHDKNFRDQAMVQAQKQAAESATAAQEQGAAAQAAAYPAATPQMQYQYSAPEVNNYNEVNPAPAYSSYPGYDPFYYNSSPFYNSWSLGWPVPFGFSTFGTRNGFNHGFRNSFFNQDFHNFNQGFHNRGFNNSFSQGGFNKGFSGGFHGGFNNGFQGGFSHGGSGFHGGSGGGHR